MLGPLPFLYRVAVATVSLLLCVGVGAWLADALPVPLLVTSGAQIGAACGVLLVLLVVHGTEPVARTARGRDHRPS